MNVLERSQYQAALAVSGAWKGTHINKIYEELGWETLDLRRYFRRQTLLYKILNNLTPEYLKSPIQFRRNLVYTGDNIPVHSIISILCRTEFYRNSFFPDSISSWNDLGTELTSAKSLSLFKTHLLRIIRPPKRNMYDVFNPNGIKWIFQLRVGLSPLKNHKKLHNFRDTLNDMCLCNTDSETTVHFFLKCPRFENQRRDLFHAINPILTVKNLDDFNDTNLVKIFLYGHVKLNFHENQTILILVMDFIWRTSRFSTVAD